MSRQGLYLVLLLALPAMLATAAEEPAEEPTAIAEDEAEAEEAEEQTLEEVTGAREEEPAEPPRSRIKRPRKLGDIFKPSEEITADSAISFPADI